MAQATLTHSGKTLVLRTNPNSIMWDFNLITKVEETYGGRVIQLLAVNIDNLSVVAEAGGGGWEYYQQVALFMRDMMVNQRSGEPGVFEYANRGWKFSVFAASFPFKDAVTDVKREFTLSFKVQEDVSGVATSSTLAAELDKLKQGVGYSKNEYNQPPAGQNDNPADTTPADQSTPPGDDSGPVFPGGLPLPLAILNRGK